MDSSQWSVVDALTSLHAQIKSSFMVCEKTSDAQGAFFEVPAKHKGEKPILFGKIESELVTHESLKDNPESPQLSHYGPNACCMMENMGYDLMKRFDLNFGQGRRALLQSFIPKGKAPDYYHQTWRGLGYVSTPIPSGSESEESLYHDHLSDSHRGNQISVSALSSKVF